MLKLIGRRSSSNVQKVLWCCAELGLPFERTDLGGKFGGNDKPEYRRLNPNGLVPTLIDGDLVLWESNTIVRYLSEIHGAGTLWPADPRTRAIGGKWMDWQLTVLSPAMRPVFSTVVRTPPEKRNMADFGAACDRLSGCFKMLDGALADSPYLAGAAFSMCDIPAGIAAYRWFNMDIPRADCAHVRRWYDRLAERPAYRQEIMVGLE